MNRRISLAVAWLAVAAACLPATGAAQSAPAYDPELARSVGADERGMRPYVLVILKNGPKRMAPGAERDAMFKGHFDNIVKMSAEGKLVLAGPLDGVDGWRGLYIFAVPDIDAARVLTETDPVIVNGEMVAEYHKYYGTAALMLVRDIHAKLGRKKPGE